MVSYLSPRGEAIRWRHQDCLIYPMRSGKITVHCQPVGDYYASDPRRDCRSEAAFRILYDYATLFFETVFYDCGEKGIGVRFGVFVILTGQHKIKIRQESSGGTNNVKVFLPGARYHTHRHPALQYAERMPDTVYRSNTAPQQVTIESITFLSEARNLLRCYTPFGGKIEATTTLLQGNHL